MQYSVVYKILKNILIVKVHSQYRDANYELARIQHFDSHLEAWILAFPS